ncbi:MAG TPA: hypothetical protein VFZ65_17475 [Planctomycetota bacterium]|nr:hypothetical protein [Planctomycetota bacterium]
MRWILAGLLFALAVSLAIGTAAIRADNARYRHAVERIYREVHDRVVEQQRLAVDRLAEATPERLAQTHWRQLLAEAQRRQGQLQ